MRQSAIFRSMIDTGKIIPSIFPLLSTPQSSIPFAVYIILFTLAENLGTLCRLRSLRSLFLSPPHNIQSPLKRDLTQAEGVKKERYILCPAREPSNTFIPVQQYQATAPQLPNHNPYRSFQTCTQTSGFCSAVYLHLPIRLVSYKHSTYQVRSPEILWPPITFSLQQILIAFSYRLVDQKLC